MKKKGWNMKLEFMTAENTPQERIYVATAILKNFRGHKNVETHLFRPGATEVEVKGLKGKGLVEEPDSSLPPQIMAGASEEAALRCILETFTLDEARQLAKYLQERYADQIETLSIAPISLPVPFGIGPLGEIPEIGNSGFINFDHAKDYPLNFPVRGYYDLNTAVQS